MSRMTILRAGSCAGAVVLLCACASLEELASPPNVSLRNVHVEKLDLSEQTFVLSFDVTNPNPFPLPIRSIKYGVKLDGQRFASGEALSNFTVPAGSDAEFAISVDVNLLQTAPELLFVVRDGIRRDIPYALEGELGLDLPMTKPVRFQNSGLIRMQALAFTH